MWYELRSIRIGAVLAVAAAAGFLVWLLVIRDDDSGSVNVKAGAGPVIASEEDLVALSDKLGQPVYWAGEQDDARLELTETTDGRVYVRYLTDDAEPGDPRPGFLTVGTYPFKNAYGALQKAAEKPGATVEDPGGGGIVVTNRATPTSTYLAYPDENFQVEVYDPEPQRGLQLASSGAVTPVS